LQKRTLGRSGIEIAPLALGGNAFGWTADEATSFSLLDAFVGAGFNLIDTADTYSRWVPGHKGGESETIIGKWLKRSGRRRDVVIATKVGMDMGEAGIGLSGKHILRSADASLKRLGTDVIDLYQAHKDDPRTPLGETLEAFGKLIAQGKVRAIGASNYRAERLEEALKLSRRHGHPRFESLQPLYNLYDRADYEENLEPLCVKEKLAVLSYFSLASGFLTGKYRREADLSKSARGASIKGKYMNPRGMRILKALDQVSADLDSTPARVALAWIIARSSVTAPIASATSLAQLADLIEATKLALDTASIESLDRASAP
jgi:aryl-alcohol dehydrogenase-like predicted oxidoreductase